MELNRIFSSELRENGSLITYFNLSDQIKKFVEEENWESVDKVFHELTKPKGDLFQFLQNYHAFSLIEFTIAIRDSQNPDEEDGIWHDDGSRLIAASLSLTLNSNIEGGVLEIKNKSSNMIKEYPCPSFGEMIVFLTGEYGFFHKINKVTKGKRIIVVLWCT